MRIIFLQTVGMAWKPSSSRSPNGKFIVVKRDGGYIAFFAEFGGDVVVGGRRCGVDTHRHVALLASQQNHCFSENNIVGGGCYSLDDAKKVVLAGRSTSFGKVAPELREELASALREQGYEVQLGQYEDWEV